MAKFDIASRVTYVDRAGWSARQDKPRIGHRIPREDRTHVIIHHTVIVDNDATPNLWETENEIFKKMRQLQTVRPDLGEDVPYNFVVFLMNTVPTLIFVCEGRGEDRSGAHTKGHNTTGIGISIEGNFESFPVDFGPYVPLISLFLGWLKFDPNGPNYGGPYEPMRNLGQLAPSGRQVFAHRDFKSTNCPGKFVRTHLRQFDFIDPR
jgi:hypothetical protein